jgi:(p)ppGpp synthase/HD superfamily hydrolase
MAEGTDVFAGAGASVIAAAELASIAHAGQTDKAGAPYFEHPKRVALKLDGDEQAMTVALLHDVLEDTGITEAELRDTFSAEIVDAVAAITHPKGEPDDVYYQRVRSNALALRVKLADIHDNLEPWRLAALSDEQRSRLLEKYGCALVALSR